MSAHVDSALGEMTKSLKPDRENESASVKDGPGPFTNKILDETVDGRWDLD